MVFSLFYKTAAHHELPLSTFQELKMLQVRQVSQGFFPSPILGPNNGIKLLWFGC
jgi:hypothetical protein